MGVKTKARPISTILDIKKIDSKTIQMVFIEKNDTRKCILYECMSADNCSEIMAKITFLRVSVPFSTSLRLFTLFYEILISL